jgi:hypothetical protein
MCKINVKTDLYMQTWNWKEHDKAMMQDYA